MKRQTISPRRVFAFKVTPWSVRAVAAVWGKGRAVIPCYLVILVRSVPSEFRWEGLDARCLGIFNAGPTCPTCPTNLEKREEEVLFACRIFSSRFGTRLCVPKIRFCNIDGEGRQGQVVRRRRRGAQSRDGEGRPCSKIDGSSTHYNRRHIRVGSGAGELRQTRSCGRDIRGGSSR